MKLVKTVKDKSQFNAVELAKAIRVIKAKYGVSEELIRNLLDDVNEFGLKKSTCSAQRIIDLWDDHCAEQFSYYCDEYGIAA